MKSVMFKKLKRILKSSFITLNGGGNDGYNVKIQVDSLKDAEGLCIELSKLLKESE